MYSDTRPEKVADGIYIGSVDTAKALSYSNPTPIHSVVDLSGIYYKPAVKTLHILMDDARVDIGDIDAYVKKFSVGVEVVRRERTQGKNVLIHCAKGINRSATLIGFYLIQCGWTYAQAISALERANERRNMPLLTNPTFRYLLQSYYAFKQHM